ncbi:hypothetical protein, partial [Melghirimyces profundicolus]|uniref:hypothetical protein n=1 Tax=Melghirimyces profundicolus TaxID=1242148 RepID=UPI001472E5BD
STPWGRIFKGGNKLLNALDEGFESLSRRWSNGGSKAASQLGLKLTKKDIKHIISRHSVESFKKQLPHRMKNMSREAVERELQKRSFFNPNWSRDKIASAAEIAYNKAVDDGLNTGQRTYQVYGENITVALRNGQFKSAWGPHNFDLKYFGY